MGLIRKTVSIGTLGIVPFRSKKEKLRRAEAGREQAEAQLERERLARVEADQRISVAEKRVRAAELTSLHAAKKAAKTRGRRGKRRAKEARTVLERLGELVETAQPVVEEQARHAGRRGKAAAEHAGEMGRRAAKRAQKEAAKAADRARKEAAESRKRAAKGRKAAKAKLKELEADVAPRVEAAVERGRVRGQEALDQVRDRVGSST
jgi:hypothetical protein